MNKVININSLSEIANKYDLFIIDQWGVLHDGKKAYDDAVKCINKLINLKKKLILISNSSKRKQSTIARLPELGFNGNDFLEVVTSGEVVWQKLYNKSDDFIKQLGKKCFLLTDKKKKDGLRYVDGLKYDFIENIEEADFILGCTTAPGLSTIDYVPLLEKAIKNRIPFICANPDYETVESTSNKLNICMGAIAELYKTFGGLVIIMGKPSIDIYIEATKNFNKIEKKRMLAIGDSIYHDIKGAINFGIDNLLITSGIHNSIFNQVNPIWNDNNIYLSNIEFKHTTLTSKFKF